MNTFKILIISLLPAIGIFGASFGDNKGSRNDPLVDAVLAKTTFMDDADRATMEEKIYYLEHLYQKKYSTKNSQKFRKKLADTCKTIVLSTATLDRFSHDFDVVKNRIGDTLVSKDYLIDTTAKILNKQYTRGAKLCIEYLDAYIDDLEN